MSSLANRKFQCFRAKRQKTVLSLGTKLEIIHRLENGETAAALSRDYGINESSIRTIRKNGEKIINAAINSEPLDASIVKMRNPVFDRMEKLLVDWLQDQSKLNVAVNSTAVRDQAVQLYQHVQVEEKKTDDLSKPFAASKGWFMNFCRRHNVQCANFKYESLEDDDIEETTIPKKTYIVGEYDDTKDVDSQDGEVVRTKWRSLRDYYRHEQRRAQARKNGTYKSSWNHFDSMHFLKDAGLKSRGQLLLTPNDNSSQDGYEHVDDLPVEAMVKIEYDEDEQIIPSDNHSIQIESPISLAAQGEQRLSILQYDNIITEGDNSETNHTFQPSNSPLSILSQNSYPIGRGTSRKRPASDLETHELEQQRLGTLEKLILENEDDDLQFFKSLIPDVKNLSRPKKALLRLKIQQLIVSEVYGSHLGSNGVDEDVTFEDGNSLIT